jgi:hypothetical protein
LIPGVGGPMWAAYGLTTRFQPPMALRFGLEVGF